MKLKDGFVTHMTGDQQIMVSVSGDFSGLIRSNETAAFIVDALKKETTEQEIIDLIEMHYDVPKEIIKKDVENIIKELRSIGALYE